MLKVTVQVDNVNKALGLTKRWLQTGCDESLRQSTSILKDRYKSLISKGLEPDRTSPQVTKTTAQIPVRMGDQKRPWTPRGNKPALSVTGKTANSLVDTKITNNSYLIYPGDAKSEMILQTNADTFWVKMPAGYGGEKKMVRRAKRDPLRVTNYEANLVEKKLIESMDRMFNQGFK